MADAKDDYVEKPSRRGTGKPSGKDRSAHDAKRNSSKIPSLREVSSELPNDLPKLMEAIQNQSDRGAALMLATMVEKALWLALRARMPDVDKATHDSWFEGINAPFQTFSAKIKLGRAFGIYGPVTESMLNTTREIRNAFAHALQPLDFENPSIAKACLTLIDSPPPPQEDGKEHPMRLRYGAACMWLFEKLIDYGNRHGNKLIIVELP